MGGANSRSGEDQPDRDRERDEDAPFDPVRRRVLTLGGTTLLVEDPPDDEHGSPHAGRRDDATVAAGEMKGLALGALEQQDENAGGDEQDRRLDERERPPSRLAVRRRLDFAADDDKELPLIPGKEQR